MAVPPLRAVIDSGHTAAVGHSMGGMAATAACWRYRIFDACVSLDGLVWSKEGSTALGEPPYPVTKPLLLLLAPQFLPADFSIPARRYGRVWRRLSLCLLPGSRHNSVSDLPVLRKTPAATGDLPPEVAADLTRRATVAFLRAAFATAAPIQRDPGDSVLRSTLRVVPGDSVPGCTFADDTRR